jgi:hypothetical protein
MTDPQENARKAYARSEIVQNLSGRDLVAKYVGIRGLKADDHWLHLGVASGGVKTMSLFVRRQFC